MTARIHARVEIDEAALERESGRDLRAFHRSLTRRIANQARADVPVRTGNLGRTIGEMPQVYTPFHVSGGVEATADYAAAVHEGSRPHRIAARSADALRFVWHGRVIFRKSVWHPGTRARPFLRNAARRVVAGDPRVH
ncbi:tail assembly chaperone [Mycobacterium phage Hosp]|uniref:tail assembly chaperone n=1 Tax=Mycobacterium phage 39HC TaxID=1463809 RepID=UPI0003F1D9AA|nr:tail assembly chaperone [Mycobacterium phage 39HC]YP_009032245.1 tail assembly chaperone [Mycobacterium phage Hosp]AHJ88321.1 tail assembly chaperone [Mycobacterium phage 39HC]AHJ88421.1 tail assembly chaperone [Mycobacterium phage 40BC]AHK11973.1 tail assembly chaperone [Mycobacterium phage Hosp]